MRCEEVVYSGSTVGFLVTVCVAVSAGASVAVASSCGCCHVGFDRWYDDGWEVKFTLQQTGF